jgi:PIN domain nuclease of toxin-antitoxin system
VKVLLDTHVWIRWLSSLGHEPLGGADAAYQGEASAPGGLALPPLDVAVVVALDSLPESLQGDPADRLIVATARTPGLPLATRDRAIRASGVVPLWKGSA